jgi:hypothetical protein
VAPATDRNKHKNTSEDSDSEMDGSDDNDMELAGKLLFFGNSNFLMWYFSATYNICPATEHNSKVEKKILDTEESCSLC